jgi:hypothetical protein
VCECYRSNKTNILRRPKSELPACFLRLALLGVSI